MLSQPLTLDESDTRGRGSVTVTPPLALPLVDEGDEAETQTGVYSSPWSSSSPLPPPSSFSTPLTHPPFLSPPSSFTFSPVSPSLTCLAPPLPPHLISPSLLSSASSICPPSPPAVSSAPFLSHSPPKAPCTPPASSSLSPSPSSSPPIPRSLHPLPPSLFSLPAPLFVSSSALPPPLHDSHPFSSAPLHQHSSLSHPPPPVSSVPSPPSPSSLFTSHTSSMCFPSPSSVHIPLSVISPPPPVSPVPVAHPPCCPCSSLLTRLLSAHRLEVRRLLRGALASLGHRLDSLERRSMRKRRKKGGNGQRGREGAYPPASATFTSSSSSHGPTPIPPVTSASSSSDSDTSVPSLPSGFSQSEQKRGRSRGNNEEEVRGRKRRKKNREAITVPENKEDDEEEEEESGRFIGQMAVSFRGGEAEGEAPLTLQNFNQKKHRKREEGRAGQSEKTVSVFRQNGYSSEDALLLLQSAQGVWTCSQSVPLVSCPEVLDVSSSQWHFSDFNPPLSLSSNHSAFRLWLCSTTAPFYPAPMLRLAVVAVESVSEFVRGGACGSPLRPLKDWTAPSSLSSDHCYMRAPTTSSTFYTWQQQKQQANHSTQSVHLPRRRPLTLPSCSANGLSGQFPASQSAASSKFLSTSGERSKRVSQIRIRRASPREMLLTPMGLPKVKRLKKKEFSLEEIYTNKNYKSPTTNRSLETIFEEPREKDGALLLIGQQRRRRLLLFPDFTQPRKRKRPQGAGLPVAIMPRKRTAARRHCHGDGDDDTDLDVMLVERLSALEDFLTRQGLDV